MRTTWPHWIYLDAFSYPELGGNINIWFWSAKMGGLGPKSWLSCCGLFVQFVNGRGDHILCSV